jgi:hypothetical protein
MKLGTGSGLVQRPSVNRGEKGGKERVRDSGGDENSSQRFWQLSRAFVVGVGADLRKQLCWETGAMAMARKD